MAFKLFSKREKSPASTTSSAADQSKKPRKWKKIKLFFKWGRKEEESLVEPSAPIDETTTLLVTSPLPVQTTTAPSATNNRVTESDCSDDSSEDDEPEHPQEELVRLKRDALAMGEEINHVKKIASTEVHKVKTENIAIKKELGKATNIQSKLQTTMDDLMKELDELRAKKEEERVVQEAAIDEVDNHHNTTVNKLKALNETNTKLENSLALATSWTDSLKLTLEANKTKSANAELELLGNIQQQDESIGHLQHQLAIEIEKTSSVLMAKETATENLVAARKIVAESTASNKDLAHQVKTTKDEITSSIVEVNRLEQTIAHQNLLIDDLEAVNQQLVESASRIRVLERAVVEANERRQKLRMENGEKIRQLEMSILEYNTTLSSIRQFL